ncbi:MAG: Flp family type IVb pilin [Actinobacteria bacterium]|nr:MAG: Flp family type IVb pilin [Actinomycetota bacterium]
MDIFNAAKGLLIALCSRSNAGDERGASAVEYSILVSLIAVAIILGALFLGTSTNDKYVCSKNSIIAKANQC